MPEEIEFRTKPQIGLELIDRVIANGVRVEAWTFDEAYGRNTEFLDGLEARCQVFVGEVPVNFHGWMTEPKVLLSGPQPCRGQQKTYPRIARRYGSSEVQNLLTYSPAFRKQVWERYRIKDTDRGPEVWEVKWAIFWRKDSNGLPSRRHCLIVARNVLTGEIKYFLSNRVPNEAGITLLWLLRVAFGRWAVESCFRQAKEELGLDHYEVRGWQCMHRHFFITQLTHLFCARMRQKFDRRNTLDDSLEHLTTEQVRRAMNTWLETTNMNPATRNERLKQELAKQQYYQRRNRQARLSHTKTRIAKLTSLEIDVNRIKSCIPKPPS